MYILHRYLTLCQEAEIVFISQINHEIKQVRWLSSQGPQCSALSSVWRMHSHGGATYTLFLLIRGVTVRAFLENWRFCLFLAFLQILPQLKTFPKNQNACIILILDATFVPNLTFLGLLNPEISFREKTVTPTDTKTPSLFCHHVPQCYRIHNITRHIRVRQIPFKVT